MADLNSLVSRMFCIVDGLMSYLFLYFVFSLLELLWELQILGFLPKIRRVTVLVLILRRHVVCCGVSCRWDTQTIPNKEQAKEACFQSRDSTCFGPFQRVGSVL